MAWLGSPTHPRTGQSLLIRFSMGSPLETGEGDSSSLPTRWVDISIEMFLKGKLEC